MASEDLVRRERQYREQVLARAELAKARAEGKFDIDDWAFGTRSSVRFPYGPPYEPVVAGVPSVVRSIAGMSAYEWAEVVGYTAVLYGAGYAVGARVRQYSPVSPRAWGLTLGVLGVYSGIYTSASTSAHRLMGFRNNGRGLRAGYEGWREDHTPFLIKVDSVTLRHPDKPIHAGATNANAFK